MRINFVGNYQSGYVGEVADEVMLTDRLIEQGHTVQRIPRDIWKAFVEGRNEPQWKDKMPIKADINFVAKWHHFNNGEYIKELRLRSRAPVIYWVWDFMWNEGDMEFLDWHKAMAEAADLVLTNEGGLLSAYEVSMIRAQYFPFDVADETLNQYTQDPVRDVAFFGSYLGKGDRVEWLKEINKVFPVTIFSWNHEMWQKDGFEAYPAVYGDKFNLEVAKTKICLQFSVNDHTWGYWSNRTGKTLLAGGFLLARYCPGMELFLKDGAAYFNSPDEAIKKIHYYLNEGNRLEYQNIRHKGSELGQTHFSSGQRVKELVILAENFLKRNEAISKNKTGV